MKVEVVPIDQIILDPTNARTHDERNIDAICDSLARFGQQKPVVVDASCTVRAGNGTVTAARKLGWDEITVVVSDLEGEEMVAYALADNRTAELAGWDADVLRATFQTMVDNEVEASDLGWSDIDVAGLMAEEPPPEAPGAKDEAEKRYTVLVEIDDSTEAHRLVEALNEMGHEAVIQ